MKSQCKIITVVLVITFGVVAIGSWLNAARLIPGRYQIVSGSGQEAVIMVDSLTGEIRIYAVHRSGSDSYRELEGQVELFELTSRSRSIKRGY